MQTASAHNSNAAGTEQKRMGKGRLVLGMAIALLAGAALAFSTADRSQMLAKLSVTGIEGNVIVEFDHPASATAHPSYRVDCSSVSGKAARASAELGLTPVVVAGLEAGEKYDCRASMRADAGTLKAVRVRAIGQN